MNDYQLNKRFDRIEEMLEKLLEKKQIEPQSQDRITIDEAAQICGLSVKTLQNYISDGRLDINRIKIGRKTQFNRRDFLEWNSDREFLILRQEQAYHRR